VAKHAPNRNAGFQHNGVVLSGETRRHVPPSEPANDPRTVVTVVIEHSLRDIPAPSPCPNCGAARQRELVLWETSTDTLLIDAGAVPGYGCTECGAKFLPATIATQLYDAAARESRAAGDACGVQRFETQARAAREASCSVGS